MTVFCARGAPDPDPWEPRMLKKLIKPCENVGFLRARRTRIRTWKAQDLQTLIKPCENGGFLRAKRTVSRVLGIRFGAKL